MQTIQDISKLILNYHVSFELAIDKVKMQNSIILNFIFEILFVVTATFTLIQSISIGNSELSPVESSLLLNVDHPFWPKNKSRYILDYMDPKDKNSAIFKPESFNEAKCNETGLIWIFVISGKANCELNR